MKRILVLSLSLICMLPLFAQQKLSVFGIAEKWDKSKEYSFNNTGRGPLFGEMVKSFAREYDANPMMHALLAQFTGDSENSSASVAESASPVAGRPLVDWNSVSAFVVASPGFPSI